MQYSLCIWNPKVCTVGKIDLGATLHSEDMISASRASTMAPLQPLFGVNIYDITCQCRWILAGEISKGAFVSINAMSCNHMILFQLCMHTSRISSNIIEHMHAPCSQHTHPLTNRSRLLPKLFGWDLCGSAKSSLADQSKRSAAKVMYSCVQSPSATCR